MAASGPSPWIRAAILAGVVYLVVPGILFAALAGWAATRQALVAWRLGAWVVSAGVFAAHLAYERTRLHSTPRAAARHVAVGVALGACGLAAAALVRALVTQTGKPVLLAIALFAWPAMLGLPAFLAAWALGAMLGSRGSRVPEP